MKRVFKKLGFANLAIETPYVADDNGKRYLQEKDLATQGGYGVISEDAVRRAGMPLDEPLDGAAPKGKNVKERNFQFDVIIDATDEDVAEKSVIYLGMGASAERLDGIEVTDSIDVKTIVSGTFGATTLKWLTSMAYSKGVTLKNLRAEAKEGTVYNMVPLKNEYAPDGLVDNNGQERLHFQKATSKDTNANIRLNTGFNVEFNGLTYVKIEVPAGEKVTLTFDATTWY